MKSTERLNQVTPVSRVLAAIVVVVLPFLGFWVGFTYQNELSNMYSACTQMVSEAN